MRLLLKKLCIFSTYDCLILSFFISLHLEMEELRSALEQLKEELGSCRWKERDAEERAANARLQKSILEQELSAAKSDLAMMEQAIEGNSTVLSQIAWLIPPLSSHICVSQSSCRTGDFQN